MLPFSFYATPHQSAVHSTLFLALRGPSSAGPLKCHRLALRAFSFVPSEQSKAALQPTLRLGLKLLIRTLKGTHPNPLFPLFGVKIVKATANAQRVKDMLRFTISRWMFLEVLTFLYSKREKAWSAWFCGGAFDKKLRATTISHSLVFACLSAKIT